MKIKLHNQYNNDCNQKMSNKKKKSGCSHMLIYMGCSLYCMFFNWKTIFSFFLFGNDQLKWMIVHSDCCMQSRQIRVCSFVSLCNFMLLWFFSDLMTYISNQLIMSNFFQILDFHMMLYHIYIKAFVN